MKTPEDSKKSLLENPCRTTPNLKNTKTCKNISGKYNLFLNTIYEKCQDIKLPKFGNVADMFIDTGRPQWAGAPHSSITSKEVPKGNFNKNEAEFHANIYDAPIFQF